MSGGISIDLSGEKELIRALEQLPRAVEKRVVGRAMAAGAGVLKRAIKEEIEASGAVDTGALAKSITVKKVPGKMMFVVGPRWKTLTFRKSKKGTWRGVGEKGRVKARAKGVKLVKRNPGAYGHLVEFGRKTGKHGTTRGRGFMRRAFDAHANQAHNKIAEKMRTGIHEEARKLAR